MEVEFEARHNWLKNTVAIIGVAMAPKKRVQRQDRTPHSGHLELPSGSRPLRPKILPKTGEDNLVRADQAVFV